MDKHWTTRLALLLAAFLAASGALFATQPFWSMEPSTREIERADSLTGFDITKYTINLAINEQTHYISGSVVAEVTAEENLTGIDYRLTGGSLAVTEVRVNGVVNAYTHQDGIIHIPLSQTQGSQFTTQVNYSGIPGNSPAPYNIGMLFTLNAVYTLSNPDAGRYWWPSYDHPWDKALVDWNITVRSDWLAAANGIRTGITDNGNGTRTHHWVCSSPVATYVMGFAAGPYIEFLQQAGDLPIQNFVLAGQLANAQVDFANVPEMIGFFSDTFGPYPFEKYGHMVVPMATYAAMEHQTMTTYGAAYLTGNQNYESIVAHELAHQWYGNYVTPLTMSEVWLKESFATYSEFLWEAYHEGWGAGCDYLRDYIQQYYISWENSNGPHTIFNPAYNLMFAPPTYEKSASVLHMLRLKLGNADFFEFIRSLLTTYPNGNLITTEFIALAEQISGQDLTQFFQQWIYSPGIPNAEFYIFHNSAGQAKVIGKSLSPTATQFHLDIPLRLPGSAVADSVVVKATPQGWANYFAIGAGDDLSTIQIDPNHWVLARQLTQVRMQLASCLPYDGAVDLFWHPYGADIPLAGYQIHRRALPQGNWQQLAFVPLTQLNYTDTSVVNNNTYEYYVAAVDSEGFVSLPSNILTATPISFPFDLGFLVVDETRNGNGANISPTDEMTDEFYDFVLQDFSFTQWDYDTQGAPTLALLSHYPLVLWHCDDFSELLLLNHLDLIGSYVLSGGKLVISGWKYPSVFDTAFLNRFLPGITPVINNSAVLVSAQSDLYPDLHPDPAKLAAAWNGMLPMSYVFLGAQDILHTAEIVNNGTNNGEPLAIRLQHTGTMVLLGYPLYFMLQDEVRAFLAQLLPELHPAVELCDELVPAAMPVLSCHPNPFSSTLTVRLAHATIERVELFNLRGQKVFSLAEPVLRKNGVIQETTLDGAALSGLPNGCYFLRVHSDRGSFTRKTLLLK